MLLPESDAFAAVISHGRGAHDAAGWAALKAEAMRWRPDGWEANACELRRQYDGHLVEHIKDAARQRYPFTADRMAPAPFSWAYLHAVNGSAVYDLPAQRGLLRDGEEVKPGEGEDGKRAQDFADMLAESQIDDAMAEAERRCVLVGTVFLRVRSDSLEALATGQPPRTVVDVLWPDDVLVIPHPRAPASLATCYGVAIRTSGVDGVQSTGTTWELWTRTYEDDDEGNPVSFGPWRVEIVRETAAKDGQGADVSVQVMTWRGAGGVPSESYPLKTLPIVALHGRIPGGAPVVDANRNLVALFDAVNVSLMSEMFTGDMNGAPVLIRKSDSASAGKVVLGPGTMSTIRRDEDVESITLGADFAGLRNITRGLQGNLALTSRQPVDGIDVERASTPESGVALKVKREPQSKARLEAVRRAVAFETRPAVGLLHVMAEVHDLWRATSILDDGIKFFLRPQDPPEYEEPEVRQRRAMDAADAGLISKAKAAVAAGWYRTEEEAQAAIDALEAKRRASVSPMQAALSRFASQAQRPVPQVPDDEMGQPVEPADNG